ncbi:MAG: helix-hairpin-helix domain-containing protein [Acidimicrobiales bacterium]
MDELVPRPAPHRSFVERARDRVVFFGLGRLVVVAVSVALVGAGGYWLVAPPPTPVEDTLPLTAGAGGATTSSPVGASATTALGPDGTSSSIAASTPGSPGSDDSDVSTTTSLPTELVVHVAGAVLVPGVHRVPTGARVDDAVSAAGGLAADADSDAINLAAPVHDGDRVYVPRLDENVPVVPGVSGSSGQGASGGSSTASSGPPAPVSINDATADQLDALPGVGPATAAAIVAYREQHGPFSSIDALADVRGIGPAKLDALRGLVTL